MKDISLVKFLPMEPKVPFINLRMIAGMLSVLAIIASIFLFTTRGLNYGIDFTGGVVAEMDFKEQPPLDIRDTVIEIGFDGATVQNIAPPSGTIIDYEYVRIGLPLQKQDDATQEAAQDAQQQSLKKLTDGLKAKYGEEVERRGQETVSGKVSGELRTKGMMAVGLALLMVLLYIWFRFEWQFGLGAVAALFHDVILTIGVFSLTQSEFKLSLIAAILTLVG